MDTNTQAYRRQCHLNYGPVLQPTKEQIVSAGFPNARQYAGTSFFLAGCEQLGTLDVPNTYRTLEAATGEKSSVGAKSKAGDGLFVSTF